MSLRNPQQELVVNEAIGSAVVADFIAARPQSAAHHQRAIARFSDGVTHDSRYMEPFQLCISHAEGAYKWDADGHRYIDLVTGHGSLILGHRHPEVMAAVSEQINRGTHLGGSHELELRWAERVSDLVPGADQVRFTSSGTEAVMLAIRLARAYTGRTNLVQFSGHFHGWGDSAVGGHGAAGLPAALRSAATVLDCGDYSRIRAALADETVAALIIETSHPTFFTQPDPGAFLRFLREETERVGTLLIVDEVVSGFRWSPGGAQQLHGVHGDLTTLAKILSGGLPGGAVAGRSDVMNVLSFDAHVRQGRPKVQHPGTYNANPLSAAAGIACLELVADPIVQQRADAAAAGMRSGMNHVLRQHGVPGCVYGASSMFRIVIGGEELPPDADLIGPLPGSPIAREGLPGSLAQGINLSMLMEGVALFSGRGITSIAHGDDEVTAVVDAFDRTLDRLNLRSLAGRL